MYGLEGVHTHTHTRAHTFTDKSDYKKPGVLAAGRHAPGLIKFQADLIEYLC